MSEQARGINQKDLPGMTTTSLKVVLDTYKASGKNPTYLITGLRARSSTVEPQKPDVTDAMLGYEGWRAWKQSVFTINYEVDFDENGLPINPLDPANIDRVHRALDEVGIEDAAVSKARVLLRDPELGKRVGNGEEYWHMTLISDPVQSEVERDRVKDHEVNLALVEQERFKYRILNCRELIDRKQELTLPRTQHKPVIRWVGNTFAGMRSKPSVVQRVHREHMGEFGLRKVYGPGQEDTVVLLSVSR